MRSAEPGSLYTLARNAVLPQPARVQHIQALKLGLTCKVDLLANDRGDADMAMKCKEYERTGAIEMKKNNPLIRIVPAVAVGFILATAVSLNWVADAHAQSNIGIIGIPGPDDDNDDEDEIPFDVADVYAELNNTDGDLGFHALIDGDAWRRLDIESPSGRKLLNVNVRGSLRRQGLTELFFESAEPPFDELSPEEFFARFEEGEYEIEGKTLDGQELESTDLFWHVMPAPPEPTVNGELMAIQCDDEEPGYDASLVSSPVTIAWDPVTTSHPTIGRFGEIAAALYQVVVEVDLEVNGEEFTSVFNVNLPPDETEMTVPEEFIALGETFKYEVLVKEATGGNQVAVESCFVVN
ncbi:MAG: hypothetical protein HC808_02960 [Candidatus Competibacteraceae bacterium]|nr:hypothetical protein [Candidatus Competibacteraceae bacterium]